MVSGKKTILTGGSRGIGREIAAFFLENGAHVAYISRSRGEAYEELQFAADKAGTTVTHIEGDVGDEESLTGAVNGAVDFLGGMDVLINNAGITRDGLVMRMSLSDWDDVLRINLSSAFITSKIASRIMLKQRSGSIINISSIVGKIGNPGQSNYAASKAGLIGLTKSLARELASRGIRVNAIAPGFIRTPMTDALNEEQQKLLLEQIPLKRYGEAREVAELAAFLASDHSRYLTGQLIDIAGGLGM
ncbi:MAG: 3-oxoacyl-[acyl-carrier-protein] reductase [Thermovirgaceae bacterium]|nr:3-oxoacyl-[acyl-carrier-protein] reductase [Thermovirgaceae bacterium]